MLRSRGISQICHTYSEDMHPIYPPLPWLHTPRLRLGVTTVAEDIWVHILLLGVVYPIPLKNVGMVDRNACNAVKQREFLHTKSLLHHAYVFVSDFLSHENDLLYSMYCNGC